MQSTTSLAYRSMLAVILLAMTVLLPHFFKTWFVESTGNIKIAPFFGFAMAMALLVKAEWAEKGAKIMAWILLAVFVSSIVISPEKPGFWLVLVLDLGLLYALYRPRVMLS